MDSNTLHTLMPLARIAFYVVAFIYIGSPILIYFTQKSNAASPFTKFDPNTLPPEIMGFFYSSVQALVAQGFTVVDYVSNSNAMARVTPIVILLVNRATGEKAHIVAMYTMVEGIGQVKSPYVEYIVRFDDDSSLCTNSIGTAGAFRPRAKHRTTRFAAMTNLDDLYAVHKYLLSKYQGSRQQVLPNAGDELSDFQTSLKTSYEGQIDVGIMKYRADIDRYVPTVFGAIYMTYVGQLWPFKQGRLYANRANARRELADFQKRGGRLTASWS